MLRNRQEEIKKKGFVMDAKPEIKDPENYDFSRIKVGLQQLDDAILDLGSLKKSNKQYSDKTTVMRALAKKDYTTLRAISNYFYEMSGIYERLCKYFAFLYRYDWYVVPYVEDENVKNDKILAEFSKVLEYLDNSNIKYMCGNIALEVIKNGCYYGYIVDTADGMTLQQLPVEYCRSRYMCGDQPAVEFNMKFFDEKFSSIEERVKVLKMFPEEFSKGYIAYMKNRIKDDNGSSTSWYLLDPACAIKLNLNGSDYPILANSIPSIIDLDAAQDLDRRKTMQKLLKIIIQKLPLDKNGDLLFDVDEARDIHNNAVQMLKRAVGVDVLTTFADIDVADLADKNTTTTTDDLKKVERTLYNAAGVSQNVFNTDGNLSLEKSILDDEASMRNLILQMQIMLNKIVKRKFPSKKGKYKFRVVLLETTIYNYLDLAKMYKEQVQLGYSKMLPQIALGHSQSSVIANAYFENEIQHLYEMMIPPAMSSTMNAADILGQKQSQKNQNNTSGENKTGGRPEKPDSEKSEKTIQNKESAS